MSALARSTDPDTSVEAAEFIQLRVEDSHTAILTVLTDAPWPLTATEIHRALQGAWSMSRVTTALSEMDGDRVEPAGRVRRGDARTSSRTWRLRDDLDGFLIEPEPTSVGSTDWYREQS